MSRVFERLSPRLREAIVARLGWSSLRPVQEEAGAALLDGKNAIILAPTAGGKTEAALFPTLSLLTDDPPGGLAALYIAPIKALLNNQAERLDLYTKMVGLERFVWHGDTPSSARKRFLKAPASLLMTTPESLEVMLVSRSVNTAALFADLRVVVVDEIHALAGQDRGAHLLSVLERIADLSRHDLQRVGLSATVGNPEVILRWLGGASERAGVVINPPATPQRRQLLVVHREGLPGVAADASRMASRRKSLFFCQSRSLTEAVAQRMGQRGIKVFVHHSSVSKEARAEAEAEFHRGSNACIVCTSTLELGIDVGDLDRVLQAETPGTVSAFLQRMGRTGRRAGQVPNTSFLCTTTEAVLVAVALVEKAREGFVEAVTINPRCWPVFIHQLFTMALADEGLTPRRAWERLSRLPDISGVTQPEFYRVLRWLMGQRALDLLGGRLVIGPAAERRFGRRNFMEMYAVFSSPQTYGVERGAGQPIGRIEQGFVDRLGEGASFLLGGRAWAVVSIQHGARRVKVRPAAVGVEPTWSGFLPQHLGFEVCQQVKGFLYSARMPSWIHESAQAQVDARRADLEARGLVPFEHPCLETIEGGVAWWTYAGGQINNTLRYALRACQPEWKIVPDNYSLRLKGEGADPRAVVGLIERLMDLDFWENPRLWAEIAEDLPNYRLSKFQPFMPEWVAREMVASFLLDIEGAWRFLGGARPLDAAQGYLQSAPERARPPVKSGPEARGDRARPKNPIHWVEGDAALRSACQAIRAYDRIGLDVETTLYKRVLCLIQIGSEAETWLIDPSSIEDLSPLAALMSAPKIIKVIHNAAFERGVLAQHEMVIEPVIDTLKRSRLARGKVEGGHSLAAACLRELGLVIDKGQQTSDWRRRPLSQLQLEYAALDAEILLPLLDALKHTEQMSLFAEP